jgi:hypothetical protein
MCCCVTKRDFALDVLVQEIERLGAADVQRISHQEPL